MEKIDQKEAKFMEDPYAIALEQENERLREKLKRAESKIAQDERNLEYGRDFLLEG